MSEAIIIKHPDYGYVKFEDKELTTRKREVLLHLINKSKGKKND